MRTILFILLSPILTIKPNDNHLIPIKSRTISSKQKHSFGYPIFWDSKKFAKDIIKDSTIRRQYLNLKKDYDYETYQYGFNVTRTGHVTSIGSVIAPTIKIFIKNKFNNYHWTPGYRQSKAKRSVVSFCNLSISLVPEDKKIFYTIIVGDGNVTTPVRMIIRKEIKMD